MRQQSSTAPDSWGTRASARLGRGLCPWHFQAAGARAAHLLGARQGVAPRLRAQLGHLRALRGGRARVSAQACERGGRDRTAAFTSAICVSMVHSRSS